MVMKWGSEFAEAPSFMRLVRRFPKFDAFRSILIAGGLFVTALDTAGAQLPTLIDLGEGIVPVEINDSAFIVANYSPPAGGTDSFLFVPGSGVIALTSSAGLCGGTVGSVDEDGLPYGESTCRTNGPGNLCSFSITPIGATIDQSSHVLGSSYKPDLVGQCIVSCQSGVLDTRACGKFFGDTAVTYFQFNTDPGIESAYAVAVTPRARPLGATTVVGLAGDEVVNGIKQSHSFFWDPNFGMRNIDTIIGQKFIPYDVSLTKDIAGYLDTSGVRQAAIFNAALLTLTPLGTFGGAESEATAVSDFGVVVGKAQDAAGSTHAFVFYGFNGLNDLNWVNPNPRFVLNEATDINNQNDIVGVATNVSTGRRHGFALLQHTGFPFLSTSGSCARKPPKPGKKCSFKVVVNDFFGRTKKNEIVVLESSRTASLWGTVTQFRSSSSRKGKTVTTRVFAPNFYRATVFGINSHRSSSNVVFVTPSSR